MWFSRQEYWSALPFSSPVDLSHSGIELKSAMAPVLAGKFFTTEPSGKPACSALLQIMLFEANNNLIHGEANKGQNSSWIYLTFKFYYNVTDHIFYIYVIFYDLRICSVILWIFDIIYTKRYQKLSDESPLTNITSSIICLPKKDMRETWVRSLCQESHLKKEMATHANILAWEITWTEEPGGLYSPWGCKELKMTERAHTHTHTQQHNRNIPLWKQHVKMR